MVQWLRALAALVDHQEAAQSSHIDQLTTCNFSSRRSNDLFWILTVLYKCGTHKLIQANTRTHKALGKKNNRVSSVHTGTHL